MRQTIIEALQNAEGPLFAQGDVLYDARSGNRIGRVFGVYEGDFGEPVVLVSRGRFSRDNAAWKQSRILGEIARGDLRVAVGEEAVAAGSDDFEEVPF